jgi:hypothetical protein
MKKILVSTSLLLSFAASSYAATLATHTPTTTGGMSVFGGNSAAAATAATTPLVKFSTGVRGLVNFTVPSAGSSPGYVVATKHSTGSKVFGTANDSTAIYWKQSPAADLSANDVVAGTSNAAVFATQAGWTAY